MRRRTPDRDLLAGDGTAAPSGTSLCEPGKRPRDASALDSVGRR